MSNPVRQQAILRLVRDRAISTQAELVDALREEGHDVVQTTISRDVHDLGLTRSVPRPGVSSTRRPAPTTPTGFARSVWRCAVTRPASSTPARSSS